MQVTHARVTQNCGVRCFIRQRTAQNTRHRVAQRRTHLTDRQPERSTNRAARMASSMGDWRKCARNRLRTFGHRSIVRGPAECAHINPNNKRSSKQAYATMAAGGSQTGLLSNRSFPRHSPAAAGTFQPRARRQRETTPAVCCSAGSRRRFGGGPLSYSAAAASERACAAAGSRLRRRPGTRPTSRPCCPGRMPGRRTPPWPAGSLRKIMFVRILIAGYMYP